MWTQQMNFLSSFKCNQTFVGMLVELFAAEG